MRRLLLTTGLILFSSCTFASSIYKWVDEKGTTHFGTQPPANQQVEPVSTQVYQPEAPAPVKDKDAIVNTPEQEKLNQEVKESVAEREAEVKKYCKNIRSNLAQLENNPRIMSDEGGQVRRLNEEERQARITEIKSNLTEHCSEH